MPELPRYSELVPRIIIVSTLLHNAIADATLTGLGESPEDLALTSVWKAIAFLLSPGDGRNQGANKAEAVAGIRLSDVITAFVVPPNTDWSGGSGTPRVFKSNRADGQPLLHASLTFVQSGSLDFAARIQGILDIVQYFADPPVVRRAAGYLGAGRDILRHGLSTLIVHRPGELLNPVSGVTVREYHLGIPSEWDKLLKEAYLTQHPLKLDICHGISLGNGRVEAASPTSVYCNDPAVLLVKICPKEKGDIDFRVGRTGCSYYFLRRGPSETTLFEGLENSVRKSIKLKASVGTTPYSSEEVGHTQGGGVLLFFRMPRVTRDMTRSTSYMANGGWWVSITVWHGTFISPTSPPWTDVHDVESISIKRQQATDFSAHRVGFYCALEREDAVKWARSIALTNTPVLKQYRLNMTGLKVANLGTEASEEWISVLKWSYNNENTEKRLDYPEYVGYDVIIGLMSSGLKAGGQVDIRPLQFSGRPGPMVQIALFTKKAIDQLEFVSEEELAKARNWWDP
ncbi:uncharacterized protein BXZ73DRAFT_84862 [Epithele typhae]|uniref:uncharacterized protein n=1 Tax=Epithele typhae TaxID=378194 RepID=UPI002008AD4B|nr:uncharacterized protein BXZ73DRAFT_84862 [Epithele typhae]KAH9906572.1 hypothetical protein BXZ73DRAFT_84862 [Epithele typhae]